MGKSLVMQHHSCNCALAMSWLGNPLYQWSDLICPRCASTRIRGQVKCWFPRDEPTSIEWNENIYPCGGVYIRNVWCRMFDAECLLPEMDWCSEVLPWPSFQFVWRDACLFRLFPSPREKSKWYSYVKNLEKMLIASRCVIAFQEAKVGHLLLIIKQKWKRNADG